MSQRTNLPAEPTVTFWGATEGVTGSMHRLDACGQSVLLDCGLVQGSREAGLRRNRKFPFRPKEIDAVLLSHAHIDHCGNLPNLVKQGFAGSVYCTPATRALVGVMLGDSAKIQQQDAAYFNARRSPGEPKLEPLYTGRDVYRTLLRLKAIPYDTPTAIGRGLEVRFADAGHLLGSAITSLRIDAPGGEKRLSFTGDLGHAGLPILRRPAQVPSADLLISEATYGGRTHDPMEETAEQLGEVVRRTAQRGGRLLIPAFSVGRTQTLVYLLHQLIGAGQLPDVPIYVDSPLAVRATEVFHAHPECFDEPTARLLEEQPDLFDSRWVRYVEKVHESVALNRETGPCVIISASGMCEAGRVLHHLKRTVDDPRSTILIAGYQAEGTLGRRIAERHPDVRILGRTYSMRAEVMAMHGLSSHADHAGLLDSLGPLAGSTPRVRLVHGESAGTAALADALRAAGFGDVAVAERGESVAL